MASEINNWCLVTWVDSCNKTVAQMGCHFDEICEVLDLPWLPGVAAREPIDAYTGTPVSVKWFRRRPPEYKVGDLFYEKINQAQRLCEVVAVDEKTGDYLYEYEMPAGGLYLRNKNGRPVSRNRLPRKWQSLLCEVEQDAETR